MALEVYRAKRDFTTTAEPRGRKARSKTNSFVVQKHDATRLHYDFRLEMDGVLKSWAVTRGPSLNPGDKRLAVHVEDHPLEYGDFEGTIPKGEYGGGTVIVWDRGTWEPVGDPRKAYAKGHLEFELHGEKLNGRWHLVRMHADGKEKHENWLLIKAEDSFARSNGAPDILEEKPLSAKTGRDLVDVAGEAPGWSSKTGKIKKTRASANPSAPETKRAPRSKVQKGRDADAASSARPDASAIPGAKKATLPAFVEPMLATLATAPPKDARWIHEIKFDGYRLLARVEAGRVKLLTRSGLDWTQKFGREIVAALRELPLGAAMIDGELVVESASGASDFSALQADLSEGRSDRFVFYAFDLLHLEGYDLRGVKLVDRKRALEPLVAASDKVRFSAHFDEEGATVLRHACRLGLEGVVSKQGESTYSSGRSKSWVKSKCTLRQEFVVGGFAPSTTSRKAIGSLALGVNEKAGLRHVGRVGTGFTQSVAQDLFTRLERLRSDENPFAKKLTSEESRGLRYVRPELVAEVEYRAITADGHLRHASFRGLREDKPASEVIDEAATPRAKRASSSETFKLTHPDRLYWPRQGVTKQGLADYYVEVWPSIEPFIVHRPLALLRCPSGVDGEQFFQKHAWSGANANITLIADPQEPGEPPLISIKDLDGLIGLVQAAVLEIHPWGSSLADWERPDMIIIDLDPGEGVTFETMIEAALETRERLKRKGLEAFVKTSGGKGLHVVAPLTPRADWSETKEFTKSLAEEMAADSPQRFVATITKAKRKGKILVDYLRNQRGATAVAAYSTRARDGAPVSMPLDWSELSPMIGPAYFTVANAPARLASLNSDPWKDFRAAAAPLSLTKATATKRKRS